MRAVSGAAGDGGAESNETAAEGGFWFERATLMRYTGFHSCRWTTAALGHGRTARVLTWCLVIVAFLGAGGGFAGGIWFGRQEHGPDLPATSASQADQWYTCGMDPQVLQKGPGNCPICGMKLTPVKKTDDASADSTAGPKERKVLYWRSSMDPAVVLDRPGLDSMGMELVPVYSEESAVPASGAIRIEPATVQNMGIRTAQLVRGPLVRTIRTIGRVDYNEGLVTFINTKFEGWIEKLGVNETGQHVNRGQPLFDVYSPKLYSAQEEFLAAVRGQERVSGASDLVKQQARDLLEAARTKLKYLDVPDEHVERLEETGEARKTLTIRSPAAGIVTEKNALEGMYIDAGMKLYTIADLSRIWVYVDIYEYQLPWISIGQTATMSLPYLPGRAYTGKVVYIYPYLDERSRVIKVRLEFENPSLELKPGMFANVVLEARLQDDALLIPREAYIDTGKRQVAFQYLGEGRFMPREIQVGVESEDGRVQVLYGLDVGDTVVTSGQFLLDAESKLKEAAAKMMQERQARAQAASAPAGHGMPMSARPLKGL